MVEPDEVEDAVVAELASSALFGARFRENAGRALLIPRAYPGRRTPLWQQRLKAQSLLEVARRYGQFPVILETYRECLQDVFDLPALKDLLRKLHTRELSLVEVETQHASPFASSLLFDYVATYMYEGDTPNAERRAAALSLDRDLLRELLGQEELRDLIDPGALDVVEADLQRLSERTRAEHADSLHDVLRRLGDLTTAELLARSTGNFIAELEADRRAIEIRVGGEQRWIAAEDAGLYRDAFGVMPSTGVAAAFLEDVPNARERIARRYARTHGPFPTANLADRYGVDPSAALRELERDGGVVRGELLPGGTEREWCDSEVLRRVRRASLAHLRHEAEAVDPAELARFLPSWQNVDSHRPAGAGPDRLREAIVPLQGIALTPEVWERDVLPRRLGAYSPAWIDQLCTAGELVWVGAGALASTGRVAIYFREDVRITGPPPATAKLERPSGDVHDAIRERLAAAPSFWLDLVGEVDVSIEELHSALWDLAWAGEVTNDAFAPLRARRLRAVGSSERRGRRFASRRSGAGEAVAGRWSLTEALFGESPGAGPRLRAQAELMLERYGIVTREAVLAEGVPGGFSSLYGELTNLEVLGTARRGYFVEGLGGAQFALAGAVERLRALPQPDGEYLLLAATDPANPYGALLPWPKREDSRRPSRTPGAFVLLSDGEPVLYVERGGRGILRLRNVEGEELAAAIAELATAAHNKVIPRLGIERIDGEPVIGSGLEEVLIEAGFSRQPRRLVASA
jgi:ATP-dependent Lhr-like helicase